MIYQIKDVLRIAKRYNNEKRSYLLINPLQGKHLPVNPILALNLMKALGDKISLKYHDAKLVIGFAETATAIGAMVANSLSEDCIYIQTTRENIAGNFIEFFEEHSHAPQQKLYSDNLGVWINNTSTVIFVDDEISTGKTLRNMIRQLKFIYPNLNDKKLIAASIINRLSDENEELLELDEIVCEYLVKPSEQNFDMSDIEIQPPKIINSSDDLSEKVLFKKINNLLNVRLGVKIHYYIEELKSISNEILNLIDDNDSVLVLGTEECMLPAIIVGQFLETKKFKVFTHSTTRSPIGISHKSDYPITEGYQIKSFYDVNRTTYIYNLKYYDVILVISDVEYWNIESVKSLINVLDIHGYGKVIFVGGNNVQHL